MQFSVSFHVPAAADIVWAALLDVPTIVPCIPGASLTEELGDGQYRGNATVKVGPVQMQFAGEARIFDIDAANRTAKLVGKGIDGKGRGNASADVAFKVSETESETVVDVTTDLQLTGAVAQYGRGAGLIKSIAEEITRQFANNLKAKLSGEELAGKTASLSAVSLGIGMLKSSFRKS